MLSLDIVSFPP